MDSDPLAWWQAITRPPAILIKASTFRFLYSTGLSKAAKKCLGETNEPDDLIATDSSNRPLDLAEVEATARQLDLSVPDVVDLFARTVANRYLQGDCSYELADVAMSQLYAVAYMNNDLGLSDFAWKVFYAFDEGEYPHDGGEQQGEALTRELLGRIELLGMSSPALPTPPAPSR